MKKLFALTVLTGGIFLAACNNGANEPVVNQDSITADSLRVADSIAAAKSTADSTLNHFGDSLKADVNAAADKLKKGAEELKDGAKELGEAAADKAKEGAEAVKAGAKKVGEAAKAGVEATKEALKKN